MPRPAPHPCPQPFRLPHPAPDSCPQQPRLPHPAPHPRLQPSRFCLRLTRFRHPAPRPRLQPPRSYHPPSQPREHENHRTNRPEPHEKPPNPDQREQSPHQTHHRQPRTRSRQRFSARNPHPPKESFHHWRTGRDSGCPAVSAGPATPDPLISPRQRPPTPTPLR